MISVQRFQRRRFKCEKLTDGRTTRLPMTKNGLWPGELKRVDKICTWKDTCKTSKVHIQRAGKPGGQYNYPILFSQSKVEVFPELWKQGGIIILFYFHTGGGKTRGGIDIFVRGGCNFLELWRQKRISISWSKVGLFPGVVKTRRGIDISVNGGGCFPRVVKISLVYIEFVI